MELIDQLGVTCRPSSHIGEIGAILPQTANTENAVQKRQQVECVSPLKMRIFDILRSWRRSY